MIDDRSTANKLESAVFQTRMLIMLDMTQSQMLKNLVAMKVDFQSVSKALKKAPIILKMRRGKGWVGIYAPPEANRSICHKYLGYVLPVYLRYLEAFLVHPMRRQNFEPPFLQHLRLCRKFFFLTY